MKVLFVVIDGCRVDSLEREATPTLNAIMDAGCWTLAARTVSPSITLPVHFSIFTSADPARHGVLSNDERPRPAGDLVNLVARLRDAGLRTAFCYNWENLRDLTAPGDLDGSLYLNTNLDRDGDERLARAAARLLVKSGPDFAFLYLGCLDEVGHRDGYGSKPYLDSLRRADAALGLVLRALEDAGVRDEYALVLQSDHGGVGLEHNAPVPEIMTVPWMACGPGIRKAVRIERPVSVLDTAPTICRLLGVEPPEVWEGRVVEEIFEK